MRVTCKRTYLLIAETHHPRLSLKSWNSRLARDPRKGH